MGPPSYVRSVVDRNVVMRRISVRASFFIALKLQVRKQFSKTLLSISHIKVAKHDH